MTLFDFQTWITFAVAAEIFLIIPGPTILLVVAYSLSHGRTATLPLLIGVGLGDLTAMIFSFAWLVLLLNRISELFFLLKWAGALYLIYMGIQLWRSPSSSEELSASPFCRRPRRKDSEGAPSHKRPVSPRRTPYPHRTAAPRRRRTPRWPGPRTCPTPT